MWLLKTEPSSYSYEDLERDGRAVWDGVKNPVALRNMKAMKRDDRVVVYHTGDVKSAIGLARVTREAYPDPKLKQAWRLVIDLEPAGRLPRAVTLTEMRALAAFETSPLLRQPRLSVVPLSAEQWKALGAK
jgi:predicted RNA-binding protein with PUA-like domain